MDELKDAQKTNNVSRFVDGQIVRTNPFGDNRAGERAYRRAERIAAAIHLLTNHIARDEPVRLKVRSGGADLLGKVLQLRDEMRATQSVNLHGLQSLIRELISLVRILAVSGFVSMQNANIMIEALDELGTYLTASQRSILAESVSLSREELMDIRSTYAQHANRAIKDVKDTTTVKDADTTSDKEKVSVNARQTEGQITLRGQSIMDVLRSGGSLGIRDISSNLPEYSEKMIQRELAGLITLGKVRKLGLKRWSKYAIV